MTTRRLADSKIALWGGVAFLIYAASELTARTEESLQGLPVIVTKKLGSAAPPKTQPKIGGLYPVFVVSGDAPAPVGSAPAAPDAQLDRLFALDLAKAREVPPAADAGKIGLPVPRAGNSTGGRAPDGAPTNDKADPPSPPPPPNMFRVDGITEGGAFITGRYFKVGDELEGIAFPVPLAPGEKAMLSGVSFEKITLMLGTRSVVLSRGAE